MDIELRHLRVLVAVADEGSLTRAGDRLVLSQPAVSRALAQLERRLGVTLVERTSRHVVLTEPGARFTDGARQALRTVDRAVDEATASMRPLRLGHTWAAAGHAATLLRAWHGRFANGSLVLQRSEDRSAGLADGDVDAAIVWAPPELPDRIHGLAILPIGRESRMAALATDDPRSAADSLRLADLSDDRLVVNPQAGTTTPELWAAAHRPHVAATVSSTDDWLVAIAAGVGVGVTVAATSRLHPHPDVRYVPLADAEPVALVLAWPRRPTHPRITALIALARDALPCTSD